ncbi:N-acetylglucosaminyldiphosphoundecaprenol N-acetyl-beta-D-mannosaminyltransferase [Clostridium sp. USBA 49]|uniref:WecB/TagA/CpsF family glycosyltransferase n=1 Tax=Clostridium sp. USBA 49 TaxID=1881060 RepID=UPI0009D079B0|nr:WecB/TagA/CpsF family glycosyltransferase [Clostridium sp. USBA 49]SKA87517.1 N-acetylglucosaminyldiphosphoundecaprenol N-acetyl-beta-D-mannosaminyltransferase [Clostridium sp. USBA 49]
MNNICNIFDVNINNLTWDELIDLVNKAVEDKNSSKYLLTINVDHVVKMQDDKVFYNIYKNADIVTADGMPIIWASKLLGKPIKEKLSGSDILPKLLPLIEKKQYRIFFLGAAEGVAEMAANNIKKKYKNIQIVGTYSPSYGFEKNEEENRKIINMIKDANVDILFVGLGAPKQEKWISKYKEEYKVPLSLGVGATFDFIAGNIKRAPKWMQNAGLEWFWRFIQEPRRLFRRYFIEDIKFFKIVAKEYFIQKY